jgi:hypothetical protein
VGVLGRVPRRRLRLLALAGCAWLAIGCAGPVSVPVQPPSGFIFSQFTAPLDTRFEATPAGSKVGTAKVQFLREPFFTNLPIITWGDASLESAAASAGIQKIHYADYELLNVLYIYVQFTVEVHGD